MEFEQTIMVEWGMRKKLKPGYRAMFHGPPGTGKTLTACLLGKYTNREVYRIDLSMIVSKYIGETEKNLSKIFEQAEHKNWILFFDEADALFGKRTKVEDAHDRYANQEVSYLLQRIEDFEGIIILASNFITNIDDAFTRRFQTVINFPMPRPGERLDLWKKAIPEAVTLGEDISLHSIAGKYEISGGAMMNVVRYCLLMTLRRGSTTITARIQKRRSFGLILFIQHVGSNNDIGKIKNGGQGFSFPFGIPCERCNTTCERAGNDQAHCQRKSCQDRNFFCKTCNSAQAYRRETERQLRAAG
jgi:SpoVK/Ycf46/Vps4 family AAA+-type ATPase